MKNRAITIAFWTLSILAIAGSIWVHYAWKDAGIGVVGSYASVVGLILTGYVAVTVRQVKKRYIRRILFDTHFRSLEAKVAEFCDETTSEGQRILAASILPLMYKTCLHLPPGKSVELPTAALRSLVDNSDGRAVNAAAKVLRATLTTVIEQISIHRVDDDWGRDDG